MIILGIDPGLADLGYGILEISKTAKIYSSVSIAPFGAIETDSRLSYKDRVNIICNMLEEIFGSWAVLVRTVDAIAIEAFTRQPIKGRTNFTNTYQMGLVIGALYECFSEFTVYEYPTHQIKARVAGSRRATKANVQQAVKRLLGLQEIPRPQHAADALAAAICHYLRHGKGI